MAEGRVGSEGTGELKEVEETKDSAGSEVSKADDVGGDDSGDIDDKEPIDREYVGARFDRLIRENRFTIAVVFPAVGALLLVASSEDLLPPILAYNPFLILLGTFVMRSPLLAGILPVLDRRAVIGLGVLVGYAYAIEIVGVLTGLPYGEFSYAIDLGPMLFGTVPAGLPVFFVPLVLNSYLLGLLLLGERAESTTVRLLIVIATVLAIDLVLDPGAVAIGFWIYPNGGLYYGVPWTNYAGWVLSATVSVALLDWTLSRSAVLKRLCRCEFALDDLVSFVILWGAINLLYLNWLPVAIAALLMGGLLRTDRFDFQVFAPDRLVRGG
ncbi:carotene biosynthesis protein [Halobacteriales archaeon QS_3_64_16]|nr:MAG: carotene biosynthesis protein [Halobacteriales archaeon QS_3_64_16]